MADWRSPGSSSPWSNYQSMGPDDDVDTEGENVDGRSPQGIKPQGIELYNPLELGLQQRPQPRAQRFSSHTPSRPDARLHIDDLRESPMLRSDLISLESNPRAPIAQDHLQPQAQTQAPPLPPPRPHRQSQSSTDAVGGSFVNQLVAGIWQPKRAASEPQIDEELQAQYAQQHTPQAQMQQQNAQQQQRLSNTRTFEDMLPRRSLLVPSPTEFDIGRHTLDPEEHLREPRVTSPSMRNLQQFRPVPVPPGAVPTAPSSSSDGTVPRSTRVEGRHSRPTTTTTRQEPGERSRGISTATSSSREDPNAASRATAVERAHRIFATKQVRFEDSWHTDMWIYMKNAHPFIGIFGAHRWHPYKRRDRVVVLLVALLVMFLCCGMFATQKCCNVVLDTPIAVVDRRLASSSVMSSGVAYHCTAFNGTCESNNNGDELPSLCTEGSTCSSVSGQSGKQCAPLVAAASSRSCGGDGSNALTCPTGWTCDASTHKCAPSSSLVCYLPRTTSSSAAVSFAAEGSNGNSGSGGLTAIEAIFGILIIANGNSTTSTNNSSSIHGSSSGSSSIDTTPTPTQKAAASTTQSISVALTKPTDGGVYSVASSVPIEWTVSALSGGEQPLKTFTVDFSADGTTFATIASDITASSSSSPSGSGTTSASVFHYDWKLNNNAALLCTKCVLRVCSTVGSGSSSSVCIRSDGGETATTGSSSSFVVTKTSSAAQKGITFRIVREILECSCGLSHAASFVEFSYLIALALPVAVLLLDQLVTFYLDSKLGGLFARRGGPVTPRLCFYGHHSANRVGRVLLVLILAAACVGAGIQLAQVNEANFYNQKGKIVLLWAAMFALCVLIGFIYCSLLLLALFSLRWKLELAHKSPVGPRNDFQRATPLLDDNNSNHRQQQRRAPLSELIEEDEDESCRSAAMLGAL